MLKRFSATLVCVLVAVTSSYASKTIGNWDCVPYRVLNVPFKLGIVAFHETGVNVEMFANGTSLGTIDDPTYNDRTDCYEYWTLIDPADYADGELNMTAVIRPDGSGHETRTLDTLLLYVNDGGSLTNSTVKWSDWENGDDSNAGTEAAPYKTVEKAVTEAGSNGLVYLKASHEYVLTSLYSSVRYDQWTTVRCAPGLTRDDVHIQGYTQDGTGAGRYGDSGIRWCNVAFFTEADSGSFHTIFYINSGQRLWADSVEFFDKNGQWANGGVFNSQGGIIYTTNCYIHDLANGVGGLRGNFIENICSDIYRPGNNMLSINMTCVGIDVGPTAAHPDFWQCYCTDGVKENCILYNCRAYDMGAQGIFGCNSGCGLKDVAFVNIMLEKDPPNSSLQSQPGGMEHVLIYHFTTVDQGWNMRSPATNVDWTVKNCNWASFHAGEVTELPGQDISHNHTKGLTWNQPLPFGTDATTGDQGFRDYDNDDYRVTDSSACYQSGTPLMGVPADIDNVLYNTSTPNRGCFAAGNTSGVGHPERARHTGIGRLWLNNPFADRLTVTLENEADAMLGLFTADGTPVICRQYGTTLETAGVPAGIYLLSVQQGNRTAILRVVKM